MAQGSHPDSPSEHAAFSPQAPHDSQHDQMEHGIEFLGGFVVGANLVGHSHVYGGAAAFTDHGIFDHNGAHIGHAAHYHGIFGSSILRGLLGSYLGPTWDDGRNAAIQAALLKTDAMVFHRAFMRAFPEGAYLSLFHQLCLQVGLIQISDSPNVNGDRPPASKKIDSWDFSRPDAKIFPSGYLKGIRGRTERAVVVYGLPARIDYCPILCKLARALFGWKHHVNRDRYIREKAAVYSLVWTYELPDADGVITPIDQEIKKGIHFTADYEANGAAYPTSPESDQRMKLLKAAFAEVLRRFWLLTSHTADPNQIKLRQAYMAKHNLKGPWHEQGMATTWDEKEVDELLAAHLAREIARDFQAIRDAGLAGTPGVVPTGEPGEGQFPVDLAGSTPGSDPIPIEGPG